MLSSPQGLLSPPVSLWQEVGPINIQPLQFRGKAISCLVDGGQYFSLLEVLGRVYFPERSLKSLLLVLNGLGVHTRVLTVREELAFIGFYNLPTRALHCKKVVSMALVAKNYAVLHKILHPASHGAERKGSKVPKPRVGLLPPNGKHTPFRPWVAGDSTSKLPTASAKESNGVEQEQSRNPVKFKARRLEEAIDKIRCGNMT